MMSIGLIRHRSICSGRCGDDHRMRRYWWRWRCVLAKPLHGCRRRSSEPTVPASLPGPTWLRSAPKSTPVPWRSRRREGPPGSTARAAVTCSTFSNSPARPSRHRWGHVTKGGRRRRRARGGSGLGRGDGVAVRRCPPRAAGCGSRRRPIRARPRRAAAAVLEVVALEAADELLRFDLVRRTAAARFRFRHPLVRRAVYESTPAAWRLGAHARCADVLATRGLRRPNGRTISSTRRHKATRWRSPRCAKPVRWPRTWHRRAPPPGSVKHFASSRTPSRRSCVSSCSWPGPGCLSRRPVRRRPRRPARESVVGSRLVRGVAVRLTSACAGVEHLLGHHDQAHARLASAVDVLGDQQSPETAALMIDLAMDRFAVMDYPSMRQRAETALSASRPLGDRLASPPPPPSAFAAAANNATARQGARTSREAATSSTPSTTPRSRSVSTPSLTSPAPSSTSTNTPTPNATPNVSQPSPGSPDRANSSRSPTRSADRSQTSARQARRSRRRPRRRHRSRPAFRQRASPRRQPHQPLAHGAHRRRPRPGADRGRGEPRPYTRPRSKPDLRSSRRACRRPCRSRPAQRAIDVLTASCGGDDLALIPESLQAEVA